MSKLQKETIRLSEEERYRHDVLSILFKWSLGITLAMALLYLVAFWQYPLSATLLLGIAFSSFPAVTWRCLYLLSQNQAQQAVKTYLFFGTIEVAAFMLLMPTNLILIGVMGSFLLIRLAAFLEASKTLYIFSGLWGLLYLFVVGLRAFYDFTSAHLGLFEEVFLYAIPVAIVIIFSLLDGTVTKYLREALQRSEAARNTLTQSYIILDEQKKALEKSEAKLTLLTTELEKSNRELRHTNEELKSFAYIVSHDLRAPLVNFKGFSAELRFAVDAIQPVIQAALPHFSEQHRQSVQLALKEDIPEALSFMDASVTRMDHLTNAMLTLSRLGRRSLNIELIDMNILVQSILQALTYQIEQHQAKVRVGLLPDIWADRLAMEQIMGNILNNAVVYLDPKRPGKIEITADLKPRETQFSIRDNGRGIEATDMHKVFEPFRRAGKQNVSGEGMGLAYVQTLVRRHGGQIWCESEPDLGTIFKFTIPHRTTKSNSHEA